MSHCQIGESSSVVFEIDKMLQSENVVNFGSSHLSLDEPACMTDDSCLRMYDLSASLEMTNKDINVRLGEIEQEKHDIDLNNELESDECEIKIKLIEKTAKLVEPDPTRMEIRMKNNVKILSMKSRE